MKRLMIWLVRPMVLAALGLIVLSVLVWWVGPLLSIGDWRPLDGVLGRLLVIAGGWLIWLGTLAWRGWRQRRANATLMKGISTGAVAIDRESEVLNTRFRDAIDKLQTAGGKARWFGGGFSLYQLPWYVFIGAPGSGKTTALQNLSLIHISEPTRPY